MNTKSSPQSQTADGHRGEGETPDGVPVEIDEVWLGVEEAVPKAGEGVGGVCGDSLFIAGSIPIGAQVGQHTARDCATTRRASIPERPCPWSSHLVVSPSPIALGNL